MFTPAFIGAIGAEGIPRGGGAVDPYFANVSALLHFDGTFADVTGKIWTNGAGATLVTSGTKFGSGSLDLSGASTASVASPSSADFAFGTGDFTIEFWLKGAGTPIGKYFFDTGPTGNATVVQLNPAGRLSYYDPTTGTGVDLYNNGPHNFEVLDGTWHHVAISKASGTVYAFFDGVMWASGVSTDNKTDTIAYVGRYGGGTGYEPIAEFDDVRITKGVGRYTHNFTPPTSAFPNSGVAPSTLDDYWDNVGALLHFNGAATTFTDETGKTWTRQGTTTVNDGSQKKFGAGALFMGATAFGNTGTLGGITTPTHVDFQAGRGDFTIEWQSYFLNYTTFQTVWSYGSTTMGGLLCQTGNGDGLMNIYTGSGSTYMAETVAASLNVWHEYKLQRVGTTLNLYRDGVVVATHGSADFDVNNIANVFSIGAEVSGQYNMAGYIDEFRFTKGVGRDYVAQMAEYPAAQTPNLTTLNPKDIGPTVLLTSKNRGLLSTTTSSSYSMVRGRVPKASGKYYFEVKLLSSGASTYALIGVATAAATLANYPGANADGWGYYQDTGQTYHNASPTTFGSTFGSGDIVGCAVDVSAGKIWWSKNGVYQNSGDPASGNNPAYTGLTGPLFPAMGLTFNDTAHLLASFDSVDLAYAPPSGFSQWGNAAPAIPNDIVLHFEGADGSTSIVDAKGGSTWSTSGGAQIATAQFKFGASSLFVNSGIAGCANMGAALGAEFCLQGWANNIGGTPRGIFHTHSNGTASGLALGWGGGSGVWELYHNGAGLACTGSVPAGWFHWAVYRLAGVIYVAINGHILNSVADTSDLGNFTTLNVGTYFNNSTYWEGYLDEIGISFSHAIYGATDFTPPTVPFS